LLGYETTIWLALFVPAKTPAALIVKLNHDVQEAVNSVEYRERLTTLDMQPRVSTPQELSNYLKSDLAKWAKVVKDAGIKPE
jgi:tripartite-type tricarboxylate transporter receptor subunit TctC